MVYSNQSPKRYIVDGPRMSGKSTLLFGHSHRDDSPQNLSSLESIATCIPEASEEAHKRLKEMGINGKKDRKSLAERVLEISAKYLSDANDPTKTYFFDRSIYSAEKFCKEQGVDISDKIKEVLSQKNFEETVFLCAPLKSIDGEGRDSYEIRLKKFDELRQSYETEGYKIIIVPVFNESVKKENTSSRIKFIQEKLRELDREF